MDRETSLLIEPENLAENPGSFLSVWNILFKNDGEDNSIFEMSNNEYIAFVTYKEQRHANVAVQCRVDSKLFSVKSVIAPKPLDIKWANLKKGALSTEVRSVVITAAFVLYCIFFYAIITSITGLIEDNFITNLTEFIKRTQYLRKYKSDINNIINSFVKGMLAPLVLNIVLLISPYLIMVLISFKNLGSHSETQKQLLSMNSNFLLYVTIIGSFVGSQLIKIMLEFSNGGNLSISEISDLFSKNIINVGSLFFNTIIQRMMVGTFICLLDFSGLFKLFSSNFTSREKKDSRTSPSIDFGLILPSVFLVLPMILVYSVICPVMIFLGFVYFLVMYYLYKNNVLYSSHNYFETGGEYWSYFLNYSIIVMVLSQIITMFQFSLRKNSLLTLSLLPCSFATIWMGSLITKSYEDACKFFPINKKEDEVFSKFSSAVLKKKLKDLEEWDHSYDKFEKDSVFLNELFQTAGQSYVFNDPSVSKAYKTILLPNPFFDTLIYIKKNDSSNIFKLNKSK